MGLEMAGMIEEGKFELQTGRCITYLKKKKGGETKTEQLERIIGLEEWAQSGRRK